MAAFTEAARAVSQILVHHHHRQASDLEILSGDALFGRLLSLSFIALECFSFVSWLRQMLSEELL